MASSACSIRASRCRSGRSGLALVRSVSSGSRPARARAGVDREDEDIGLAPSGAERPASAAGEGRGPARRASSEEDVPAARRPGGIGQAREERLPGFEQALAGGDLGDALVETVAVEERLAGKPIEMGAQGPRSSLPS